MAPSTLIFKTFRRKKIGEKVLRGKRPSPIIANFTGPNELDVGILIHVETVGDVEGLGVGSLR